MSKNEEEARVEGDLQDLIIELLDIDENEDVSCFELNDRFIDRYGISVDESSKLIYDMLNHVPAVQGGLTGKTFYKALVSKREPVMLIKKAIN